MLKILLQTNSKSELSLSGGRSTKKPTLALLHCYDLIDDFLDSINISFDTFCKEFVGSWMFGYADALEKAGVQTILFCISARVDCPTRHKHIPTGITICLLPASKAYKFFRKFRNLLLKVYGAKNNQTFSDVLINEINEKSTFSLSLSFKDFFKSIGSYLSTPIMVLSNELKKDKCQVILCQEYEFARFDVSVLLGKLLNIPVFATFQGGNITQCFIEYLPRYFALHFCQGTIIATRSEIDRVCNHYHLPDHKTAQIFNPVDLTSWHSCDRTSARAALGLPLDAQIVVWHGRIEIYRKGLDILLNAWRLVCARYKDHNLLLLLLGTGSDALSLRQQLELNPISNLIWIDQFINNRGLINQYLSAANLYVMASRQEGFPVAPIEAMACGLPVVATDAPGISDIFEFGEHSGGIVVPQESVSSLSSAILRVLCQPDSANELGNRARLRAENYFSLEAVGKQLREYLFPGTMTACISQKPKS